MRDFHIPQDYVEHLFQKFCAIQEVWDIPSIRLMTAKDRNLLAYNSLKSDHDQVAMWSTPFSGGIMLAQYITKNPHEFVDKRVIDIGSGSGIVAIAAAKAGATVTAIDSHPCAFHAIQKNAALNDVSIEVIEDNAVGLNYVHPDFFDSADIITAADLFYVHAGVPFLVDLLGELARKGKSVFVSSQDEDLNTFLKADGVEIQGIEKFLSGDGFKFVKLSHNPHIHHSLQKPLPAPRNYNEKLNRRFAEQRASQRAAKARRKSQQAQPL